jgi:hypothetical protein
MKDPSRAASRKFSVMRRNLTKLSAYGVTHFRFMGMAVEQVIETATGQVSPYVQTHIDEERPRTSGLFRCQLTIPFSNLTTSMPLDRQ